MTRSRRSHEQAAHDAARLRAEQNPNRIRAYKEIVEATTEALERNDFALRSELYGLLAGLASTKDRAALIDAYGRGLEEVNQEGRFNIEQLANYDTDDRPVSKVLVDEARNQIVVCIGYDRETSDKAKRKGAIRCFERKTGNSVWGFELRVKEEVSQAIIHNDLLICIPNKDRGDFGDGADSLIAISLEDGDVAWKFEPYTTHKDEKWREAVEAISGVVGEILYVRTHNAYHFLDLKTGKEQKQHSSYLRGGSGNVFAAGEHGVVLQLGEWKLGWFNDSGELINEHEFPFSGPKEEDHNTSIQCSALAGGPRSQELIVVVQSRWDEWDEGYEPIAYHGRETVFGVALDGSSTREIMTSDDFDGYVRSCPVIGNRIFIVGNKRTVVISRRTGKVIQRFAYEVGPPNGGFLYDTGESWGSSSESFDFSVRKVGSADVLWKRPQFNLELATADVLYGMEVEEGETWQDTVVRLVLLDVETGKELAEIPLESNSRIDVRPLGPDRLLVAQWKRVDLYQIVRT